MGVGFGAVAICAAYIFVFSWPSFWATVINFFEGSLVLYLQTVEGKRFEQYLDFVVALEYFPFIALVGVGAAYRHKYARDYFMLAWSSVVFAIFIILVTPRGVSPEWRYLYVGFVGTVIGLAIVLGDVWNMKVKENSLITATQQKILISLASVFFLILGIQNAIRYDPSLYTPSSFPLHIKYLYLLGPLFAFCGLLAALVKRETKYLVLFILSMAIWTTSHNSGLALRNIAILEKQNDYFYEAAQLINEVPGPRMTIYVNAFEEFRQSERIVTHYAVLFNEKYTYGADIHHIRDSVNYVKNRITYVDAIDEIIPGMRGYLVTDDPNVFSLYPEAYVESTILWRETEIFLIPFASVFLGE
jgi:hypothetical protein